MNKNCMSEKLDLINRHSSSDETKTKIIDFNLVTNSAYFSVDKITSPCSMFSEGSSNNSYI